MSEESHILVVDDDEDILVATKILLRRYFTHIHTSSRPEEIPTMLTERQYEVVLLDMNYDSGESSGSQGLYWLEQIIDINPQAVVIVITAHGGINLAVKAMKKGAADFVLKPWHNEKLVATILGAIKLSKAQRNVRQNINQHENTDAKTFDVKGQRVSKILGRSSVINKVLSIVKKSAPTDANILITGENGTGKELVARKVFQLSERSEKPFITVDLGALSESLFESELFGHKKGAFTDAKKERVGLFRAADKGTLFLDEIGNIPLQLQSKLLSVLEQRRVTPVGSNESEPFDVRIISATNRPVTELLNSKHFRQDLLYRLNTIEVHVPALRSRVEDIEEIVTYYVELYVKKYQKSPKVLRQDTIELLKKHDWPGNIRSLRHAAERAVVLTETEFLKPEDFLFLSTTQLLEKPLPDDGSVVASRNVHSGPTEFNLERLEKSTIEKALITNNNNILQTAKMLGITRSALYRRIEKHGIR